MVDLFTRMGMFMRENGNKTRLMEEAAICIEMEHHTKETGLRTNNMALVLNDGQTGLVMRVNIAWELSTVEVLLYGVMGLPTKESS